MEKNERKSNYGIKGKLISAIAMLLVATIMVVSSTYAWFTLSTAPEVSGVSTAVGANGALEMLLATWDDAKNNWKYGTGSLNGATSYTVRNTYWGNLVDLSDDSYGSEKITLYPSALNLVNGKLKLDAPIQTPEYGADGRVNTLAEGGQFGKYNGTSFVPAGDGEHIYGFRGLGVASGLTDRQQAFRAALSAMSTAQYQAQTEARNSLSANGTPLANIAILKAMSKDATPFSQSDVDAIGSMISGLEAALRKAEDAYIKAVLAYALSQKTTADDAAAIALSTVVENAANIQNAAIGARLSNVFKELGNTQGAVTVNIGTIQSALNGYSTYTSALEDVTKARTAHTAIAKAEKYSWDDINDALIPLVNVEVITINGFVASEVKENQNTIAGQILGGQGVKVIIPTNGGVYADIADLAGNYTVDIEIQSDSLDVGVEDLTIKANMSANSTVQPPHLTVIRETFNGTSYYPAGDTTGTLPLTELYGYVIDLAFRTNAAQSNLLLQSTGVDRIYSTNNNEQTMGKGSTMTFKSSSPDFDTEDVKDLMSNIRVVFYNTVGESNMAEIYAYAKLDVTTTSGDGAVVVDANGVTAQMFIYKTATEYKYTSDENTPNVIAYELDGKYYSDAACTTEVTLSATEIAALSATGNKEEVRDDIITSLDQNEIKHVSALVYLDGEGLENSDVAANAATSMTGTVNFQFASSATLTPMEYSDLHTVVE